jgi:hypothetical protein
MKSKQAVLSMKPALIGRAAVVKAVDFPERARYRVASREGRGVTLKNIALRT